MSSAVEKSKGVDRSIDCPSLLMLFVNERVHHGLTLWAFSNRFNTTCSLHAFQSQPPSIPEAASITSHVWPDTSLRDLAVAVMEGKPETRRPSARFSFSLVYPDKAGRLLMKHVGEVGILRDGPDDKRTLQQVHYNAGDYMSVAIV